MPLGRAPTVVVENGVVHSDGETILGADDKAAVTAILLVLRDLAEEPPDADVEVVFSAGEEIGLQGAKALDVDALGGQRRVRPRQRGRARDGHRRRAHAQGGGGGVPRHRRPRRHRA